MENRCYRCHRDAIDPFLPHPQLLHLHAAPVFFHFKSTTSAEFVSIRLQWRPTKFARQKFFGPIYSAGPRVTFRRCTPSEGKSCTAASTPTLATELLVLFFWRSFLLLLLLAGTRRRSKSLAVEDVRRPSTSSKSGISIDNIRSLHRSSSICEMTKKND